MPLQAFVSNSLCSDLLCQGATGGTASQRCVPQGFYEASKTIANVFSNPDPGIGMRLSKRQQHPADKHLLVDLAG